MIRKMTVLLLGVSMVLAAGRIEAQQQREEVESPRPDFLKPPPRELLQQGLQPLSAELPDSQTRDGLLPPDASEGLFTQRRASYDRGDQWTPINCHWAASGNRYRPVYFEDTMLERHGQSRGELVQPFASGTRFFASIAALPYKAALNPPHCPTSSLGHYRVGSGAPCLLQRPPLQADAGLLQAGLVVGLIFIVP